VVRMVLQAWWVQNSRNQVWSDRQWATDDSR